MCSKRRSKSTLTSNSLTKPAPDMRSAMDCSQAMEESQFVGYSGLLRAWTIRCPSSLEMPWSLT